MLWTRLLISTPPLLLASLLIVSFTAVKSTRFRAANELSIGVAGEAETLNPILATTQVAGRVGKLLFNGLLRLDEDLQLSPDLAESWEQKQVSTIFFRSSQAALEAGRNLESLRAQWPGWGLLQVEAAESELRLHLETPGTRSSREIFACLDASEIAPLTLFRLEGAVNLPAAHSPLVKRVWRDGSRATELTLACRAADAARELTPLLAGDLAEKAHPIEELAYLDEPEIIFRLRRDVRWHDGTPFSARDVEFTFGAIVDDTIGSPRRADYQLVQSCDRIDPRTVRIVYRKPYSFALQSWTIGLLPSHLLAGHPLPWWTENFNRHPIGTGPFQFEKWVTNEYISLAKNSHYFRGEPHLDRIVFRAIPDRLSMRIAFQTDQVDLWNPDPYSAAQLQKNRRFEILSGPALEYHFIGWNLRRPLLADKRVRHALAHAIDTEAIIRYVIYDRGVRATGPFVPSMWFFDDSIAPLSFDPALARRLLTAAGWQPGADGVLTKGGERFRIELVTNNDETRKDLATLVQDYLRQVGVEVDVRAAEWAIFISQFVHTRAFDGLVLSWALPRNDPDQYQIWHSSQAGPRQLNIAGYSDSRADQLLEQIRIEYEPARIKELAAQLQRTIYDDQPYAFLYVPLHSTVMRSNRFRMKYPINGGWHEEAVRMRKAGVDPEWLCRVAR